MFGIASLGDELLDRTLPMYENGADPAKRQPRLSHITQLIKIFIDAVGQQLQEARRTSRLHFSGACNLKTP